MKSLHSGLRWADFWCEIFTYKTMTVNSKVKKQYQYGIGFEEIIHLK